MSFIGSSLIRKTLTMILAGGQGERLSPLTEYRTKPSVPFGGKYRIIDFALSNCLNSGLRKIYVLTQYKSDSLNQHLYEGWNIFNPELMEFIYSIPPQFKISNNWYTGTANAIFQNLNLLKDDQFDNVLILSGDHIYKMDYLKMLQYHVEKNPDLSISSLYVPISQANRFGVLGIDQNYKVLNFIEKPNKPPEIPDKPGYSFVNMGIYIFKMKTLKEVLTRMESEKKENDDFGKHVIPYMIKNGYNIRSFRFEDENKKEQPYWVDVGTIDSYYAASMDLISVHPTFNLYDFGWPLRTKQLQYPPAKTVSHEGERVGRALNSLISDGTVISGGLVERSLIGFNVRVNSYSYVTDSIIMDNVNIGRHCKIRRTIIDKNVEIPEGTEIGFDTEIDKERFKVSETGIVVIPKNYKF
ncbi:MAG: glucose-1-phosphate adenylyltransferase [Melioribacteraceae bacterium]|nr:glucose-1-phosphate adenylyltransferase [Melioribacteraceae bacterium]MCF8354622.1 glucose-1-phosphate adenylyltransferase [Melioribacteraceae bacterium]MCF8395010.1 glucose-1-phosphate adenylyltransferase [Melioribacteraceae bacterium]MCF8418886.1 glucose-1-phosphate adenylyltransferase [Melioribacteraceae bacterium]